MYFVLRFIKFSRFLRGFFMVQKIFQCSCSCMSEIQNGRCRRIKSLGGKEDPGGLEGSEGWKVGTEGPAGLVGP